jgi:hypothetical protein
METQLWKFKCRGCGQTFVVESVAGQKTIDFARQKPCPNCHVEPGSMDNPWHQVIGFQSRRSSAPAPLLTRPT